MSLQSFLRAAVLYLVPMILSLSVHEFAHALVATRLGDDTPEREERLTLSPAAHVDVWGTFLVPLMSILFTGHAYIGWARPVNVNPSRFRRGINMRSGMALTAVAGPLSNLLLAVLSVALFLGLGRTSVFASATGSSFADLLKAMFHVNIGLCVFNLLPIPPLDGSRLLPRSMDDLVEKMGQWSFLLIMVVLSVRPVRTLLIDLPVELLGAAVLKLFGLG